VVTAGAICSNWMSSADSTWLDTTRNRYTANNNDQEKEIAVNIKQTNKQTNMDERN